MTVRLDGATRRKLEGLAARESISLDEAIARVLRAAPDEARRTAKRRRYRIRPRRVAFGFGIADARRLASELTDERAIRKLASER
jgi:hypothetical protein